MNIYIFPNLFRDKEKNNFFITFLLIYSRHVNLIDLSRFKNIYFGISGHVFKI